MTTHVDVVYRAERDISGWERRHAAGEVPGRWPYGLDLLERPGVTVRAVPLDDPTRVRAGVVALRGALGGRRLAPLRAHPGRRRTGRPRDERTVGVAWDENMARRMVRGAPRPEMAAGVIWLTDRLAADPQDARGRASLDVLRRLDLLWVLSRAQVEPLRRLVGPGGPRVEHVPFGVDERFFSAAPWPDRPLVLSVGGDRDRDPATLLEAMAEVVRRRPDVEVVVQTPADVVAPPGVTTVRHLPHRELRDLYRRASVVALATRPNLHVSGMTVSLEAMATARPVVLTRTPGVEDYVEDGVSGLLVPPGDAQALAHGVLEVLADPDAAERRGRAARALVERGLTSAHMVKHMSRLLGLPQSAPA